MKLVIGLISILASVQAYAIECSVVANNLKQLKKLQNSHRKAVLSANKDMRSYTYKFENENIQVSMHYRIFEPKLAQKFQRKADLWITMKLVKLDSVILKSVQEFQ
jgi:hypothetical protein